MVAWSVHSAWIVLNNSKHFFSGLGASDAEMSPESREDPSVSRSEARVVLGPPSGASPRFSRANSKSVWSRTHPLRCAWSSTLGSARHAGVNKRARASSVSAVPSALSSSESSNEPPPRAAGVTAARSAMRRSSSDGSLLSSSISSGTSP